MKEGQSKTWIVIASIVVVLVAAIGGWLLLNGRNSNKKVSTTNGTAATSALEAHAADANGLVAAESIECVPRGHDNYRTNNALAVDPSNANIVYVGVEYKGIYKTTDGGATWQSSDTGVRGYPMEADVSKKCVQELGRIIIDPKDATHLLASRVESPGDLTTLFSENAGVYESTDAGATWHQRVKAGMNASGSRAIAFDPRDSKTIYYGVNNMTPSFTNGTTKVINKYFNTVGILYQTKTGGQTWSELPTGAEHGFRAVNVAVDPTDSNKLWLFTFNTNENGETPDAAQKAVLLSADGGKTWTSLASKLPTGSRTLLGGALSPKDGKNAFITTQTTQGSPKSFATVDGGSTWTTSNVYILAAAYDPNDSTGHRLLGYAPYDSAPGIYESMDGGLQWSKIALAPAEVKENGTSSIRISSFAWSVSTPATVYMSGDSGLAWKSTDNGKTWTKVLTLDKIGGKNKNKDGSEKSREQDQ